MGVDREIADMPQSLAVGLNDFDHGLDAPFVVASADAAGRAPRKDHVVARLHSGLDGGVVAIADDDIEAGEASNLLDGAGIGCAVREKVQYYEPGCGTKVPVHVLLDSSYCRVGLVLVC